MQEATLSVGRKLSLYLLMIAAVVVATTSANASLLDVPETSGGSAELLAVFGVVSVALMLRRKATKDLTMQ